MSDHAYDGTPLQAGLRPAATQLTGQKPHYSSVGLRFAVVVDIVYSNQPGNRSRTRTEYTCRDLQTGELIPHCQTLVIAGGISDGDDVGLAPATQTRPGVRSVQFTQQTVARDTDGTVVLLGFVEGSKDRPVILGAIQHLAGTLAATAEDGLRRLTTHKGTSVEFKQDGTYDITRTVDDAKKTSITCAPDGNVTVRHHSGASLVINDAGVTLEGARIKHGAGALEPLIKGNTYKTTIVTPSSTAMEFLSAQLSIALQSLASDITFGVPSGATVASLQLVITTLLGYLNTQKTILASYDATLSTKVVTE